MIIDALPKVPYERRLFTTEKECSICFMEFSEGDQVTPLPCDLRHTFHSECLTQWFKKQATCPLCKQDANLTTLEQFNRDVHQRLEERALTAQADEENGRRQDDNETPF